MALINKLETAVVTAIVSASVCILFYSFSLILFQQYLANKLRKLDTIFHTTQLLFITILNQVG